MEAEIPSPHAAVFGSKRTLTDWHVLTLLVYLLCQDNKERCINAKSGTCDSPGFLLEEKGWSKGSAGASCKRGLTLGRDHSHC